MGVLVARGQDSDETGSRRSRHSIGGMGESLWCLQVAETCKAWPDAGRKRVAMPGAGVPSRLRPKV